jgi:carbon-monoxide dehydrogenase small subunit
MVLACQVNGAEIVTNAGLGTMDNPHPLQEAFADSGAVQCGFCTSGMIISAKALLDRNPHPTEGEIREALSGNLCRCTGYGQIVEAVQIAAEKMGGAE